MSAASRLLALSDLAVEHFIARPLWIVSATGWAAWMTVHFVTRPWEFLEMPTYRVYLSATASAEVEVEAETEDAARYAAYDAADGHEVDWAIDFVEEVPE